MHTLVQNNKMKQLIMLFFTCVIIATGINAQEATLTDIPARKFEGVKEIEGIGYYTFYFEGKAKKGKRDFVLVIYDYDLNEINTAKVNLPKHVVLVDGVFNGSHLLIGFIDARKKKVTYITFDSKGNKVKERYDDVKNKQILTDPQFRPRLFGGEDGSFFIVKVIKEKKYGFQVEKVDSDLGSVWIKSYVPKKGLVIPVDAVNENGVLAIMSVQYEKRINKKRYDVNLSAFNTDSGDHMYEATVNNSKYFPVPSSLTVDSDQSVVLGGMYYEGEKEKRKNSDGVFLSKYDVAGKKVFFKTTGWDQGLQKMVKSSINKEFLSGKPMVLFHDIESTADGYRVIGESFRKAVDGLQTAMSLVGGGGNINMKFSVFDFTIFNFEKDGKVAGMDIIPKEPRNIDLESIMDGGLFTSTMYIAKYLEKFGYFGYRFTTEDASGEDAIVYYNLPGGTIKLKVRPYFAIAKFSDPENPIKYDIRGKDRKFAKRLGQIGVLDSDKGGQVLLYNYDRKEKAVTMWIEKY